MKYDPTKEYTWGPDDKFEVTGRDLGMILSTVRSILSTEEAKQILLADKTNSLIEEIIASHVEKGVVKEVTN